MPDFGLGFQVEALETSSVVPSSLGSGSDTEVRKSAPEMNDSPSGLTRVDGLA